MAKGYWIAHVDVADAEAYKKYVAAIQAPFVEFGARYVTRGGEFTSPEGPSRSRHVVIEFPSYQAALDCYHSPEYTEAKKHRVNAADSARARQQVLEARIAGAEIISRSEAEWLNERIGRGGHVHENEKALLQFLKEESPDIHPSLKVLIASAA